MRPVSATLSAAGFSVWIAPNRQAEAFTASVAVVLSSGAVLTYSAQHTFDPIFNSDQSFSISRTTTVATVTRTLHGLSVGDWIQVDNASAPLGGTFSVASVVDANSFTYTVPNSGATSLASGVGWIHTARILNHEFLVSKTVSDDSNYAFPVVACRLNVSAYTSGTATLTFIQGG